MKTFLGIIGIYLVVAIFGLLLVWGGAWLIWLMFNYLPWPPHF